MHHKPAPPVTDARGNEHHPAFGMLSVNRVTSSHGISLFQSDLKHRATIRIVLESADRHRDLSHDYVHGRKHLVELEMSLAQWASFVSSMNTSGVPVTIRSLPGQMNLPGIPHDPRLAQSMAEVKAATRKTYDRVKAATDALESLPANAGVRARREAVRALRLAVDGVEPNLTFAASSMEKYADDVVQKARADVEAMVGAEVERLGLEPGQESLLELPGITDPDVIDGEVGES